MANEYKKQDMIDNPEKYKEIYKKISQYQTENNSMKNRIWITRKDERKVILKSEYLEYKENGWVSAKEKNENAKKTLPQRWINNGEINKLIPSFKLEEFLYKGFVLGRISSRNVGRY